MQERDEADETDADSFADVGAGSLPRPRPRPTRRRSRAGLLGPAGPCQFGEQAVASQRGTTWAASPPRVLLYSYLALDVFERSSVFDFLNRLAKGALLGFGSGTMSIQITSQ